MNHIFCSIWNDRLQRFVVADERAKSWGKKSGVSRRTRGVTVHTGVAAFGMVAALGALPNAAFAGGYDDCTATSSTTCGVYSGTSYTNPLGNSIVVGSPVTQPAVQIYGGNNFTNNGTISGFYTAVSITGALSTLTNTGSISSSVSAAISVQNAGSLAITNIGTLTSPGSLAIDADSSLTTLNLLGSSAVIAGDVFAESAAVNLLAGSTFTQTYAFDVNSVNIGEDATWKIGRVHSSTGFLQPYITAPGGVTNAGTLEVLAGYTAKIAGNYTQTSTGVLQTDVGSDGTYGKLSVSGTATFADNAQIKVNVANPAFTFSASALSGIITAGTLVSNGFKVTDNSLLFNFKAVANGNQIDFQVVSAADDVGDSSTTGSASSPTTVAGAVAQQRAGAARGSAAVLDAFIAHYSANGSTGNADMDTVVGALGKLTTSGAVSAAAKQTLPVLAGNEVAGVESTLSQTQSAVSLRQSGVSSGDATLSNKGAWIKPFGTHTNQNAGDGVSGFRANTFGLVMGADADVTAADRLGVAFGYGHSHLNNSDSDAPSTADVNSYQAIFYGTHRFDAITVVDFQADGGYHRTSGERDISFGGLDRNANSGFNGYSGHAGLSLARTVALPANHAYFTPRLSMDYTWIHEGGYQENGAGALNLQVGSHNTQALIFRFTNQLDQYLTDRVKVSLTFGAGYDALARQNLISSNFVGGSGTFTTYGVRPSHWLVDGGLGISGQLNDRTTVSLDYAAEGRKDYISQTVSAKLRMAF